MRISKLNILKSTTILTGAALIASAGLAQTAQPKTNEADTIIVTGSRIARTELKASVPVSVLSSASIAATGVSNIQDALKDLPAAGQAVDRQSSNFSNTGNAEATVSLRNLGSSRTLVLINGRRSVGIAGSSALDLNNIPTDLIDHVEVVTGGASAIYGSDAVAGVVNIILKNKFKGLELHMQDMGSDKADAQNRLLTATAGTDFGGGRGHILAHFSYNDDEGLSSANRSFSANDQPSRSSFAAQGLFSIDGKFSATNGNTYTFDNANNLKLYQGANVDGYNRAAQRYLSLPVARYQGSIIGDYELSPKATLYYEASYTKTKSNASLEALAVGNTGAGAVTNFDGSAYAGIPITSPYVPAAIAAAASANSVSVLQFRRRSVDIFSRSNKNDRDYYRGVIGLKGNINSTWHYDISYEHSEDRDHTNAGAILNGNYGAALSNTTINGQVVCSDPVARAAGCVPINIFGYNTVTPAAAKWLQTYSGVGVVVPGATVGQSTNFDYLAKVKQDVASININGSLFKLPGGPIGIALGAEYRREKSSEVFDPFTQVGAAGGNQISNTIGSFSTKEAYLELNAPLLKDRPFVKDLSLEGAVRYADYNTVGGVWTYKYGGSYAPSSDIRFRAIYAQAVRAPNIGELFSAQSQTFPSVIDPCDQNQGKGDLKVGQTVPALLALPTGCAAIPGIANYVKANQYFYYTLAQTQTIDGLTGGNQNLQAEKTNTLTVGTVITPSFFRRLSVTVDYYTIKVKNAIASVDPQTSVDQCFATGSAQFCNSVIRNGNGFITRVNQLTINAASYLVAGIDTQVHLAVPLNIFNQHSKLDLTLNYNHKLKQQQTPFAGGPISNELGTADIYAGSQLGTGFKDQFTFNANYEIGALTFAYRMKYLGAVTASSGAYNIPAYMYHNLQAKVTVGSNKRFELYGGVDNLFDKQPPLILSGNSQWPGTNTVADTYDTVGRVLYLGARAKF